jgi:hypothetical protein
MILWKVFFFFFGVFMSKEETLGDTHSSWYAEATNSCTTPQWKTYSAYMSKVEWFKGQSKNCFRQNGELDPFLLPLPIASPCHPPFPSLPPSEKYSLLNNFVCVLILNIYIYQGDMKRLVYFEMSHLRLVSFFPLTLYTTFKKHQISPYWGESIYIWI